MSRNQLRMCLMILLSGLFIFGCSQLGFLSKKETPEPTSIPDCKKNYTKEGNLITGRIYKTWVKYENLDFKKGFDIAIKTIQAHGNRLISTDIASGTITAEMVFDDQKKTLHPVEINLVKEKTSLMVYLSSKAAGGPSGPAKFCSFCDDFEKLVKRSPTASLPKQTTALPKKPAELEKESAPPASSPEEIPKVSPSPTVSPSQPPVPSLPQAKVKWTVVNLREGPGTKHKIVGKAKRGTLLNILEEEGGWLHIRLDDGKEAWLIKKATSEVLIASPPSSSPSSGPLPSSSPPSASSVPRSPM